ncbi:hypothetical protein I4U23_004294 [Adineta vaga]|nr:hypothetical protein I4U23_004294 [Adineta vaga]
MDNLGDRKQRRNTFVKVFGEYKALLIKMLLLTKRKRGQTIAEILLAYLFLALLLSMRYLLSRSYKPPLQIPSFHPYEPMLLNSTRANMTYYFPDNPCTTAIVTNAMNKIAEKLTDFPNNVEIIPDPMISSLPQSTIESIYAYI